MIRLIEWFFNHKDARGLQDDWLLRGVKELLSLFFLIFSSLAYLKVARSSLNPMFGFKIRKGRQQ